MAECLFEVAKDYEITDRIGYFTIDNAEANSTCIAAFVEFLDPTITEGKAEERRLRCWGHILNLGAKAFLLGDNAEGFEAEMGALNTLGLQKEELQTWRKKGALGKLHNLVVFIRASSQRREMFLSFTEADGDTRELLLLSDKQEEINATMLIRDNDTRWNSCYMMIERALKKRREIELFTSRSERLPPKKRVPVEDQLTEEDWNVLTEAFRVLQPFYYLTKRSEGRAKTGSHGGLWEALTSLDFLINGLEREWNSTSSVRTNASDTTVPGEIKKHLRTALQQALVILRKYHVEMCKTPVYVASIVLHPSFNWWYFEKNWSSGRMRSHLIEMKEIVRRFWQEEYRGNA
jgi:hypothetical protein